MMTLPTSDFNPWNGMHNTSSANYYASRRVDTSMNPTQRDLHWSLTETGNSALLIGYNPNEQTAESLPRFKGIIAGEDQRRHLLIIALQDPAMREAFLKVCVDIVTVLQNVSEQQQRHAVILRLERWAHFFQGKRARLSDEEQKGLIAELTCLQNVVLRAFSSKAAVQSWTGPQRSVHDFSFGQTAIEVKSNRGSGTPNITISSETQLSVNEYEALFLYVVEVNRATAPADGLTLADYVQRTRRQVSSSIDALEFDLKLSQVGYEESDDYSGTFWGIGAIRQFNVTEDFPHIDETLIDPAISGVIYKVNLNHCGTFEVSKDALLESLGADNA